MQSFDEKSALMRIIPFLVLLLSCNLVQAQPILKVGDMFPDYIIRNIVNAPVKQLDVRSDNKKLLIINFWGTWCSPCIPEMDSLKNLAIANKNINIVAISNDKPAKLQKYLQEKPTPVWLASDSYTFLYQAFNFNYVGQAAVINQENRIVALVRTDSINQQMIDKLLKNEKILSSAETNRKEDILDKDPFAVDTAIGYQVNYSGYRKGYPSMQKTYINTVFGGRRKTYINVCITNLIRDVYGITNKQLLYEVPEEEICEFSDKNTVFCFDITVKPEQKDSFNIIMENALLRLFPVKFRKEQRVIPVWVLTRTDSSKIWKPSTAQNSSTSFSGNGFKGEAVPMKTFAYYIANELDLPVVDETGLTDKYDINTENVVRTSKEVKAAINKLGLKVEKAERKMDVVIIYK